MKNCNPGPEQSMGFLRPARMVNEEAPIHSFEVPFTEVLAVGDGDMSLEPLGSLECRRVLRRLEGRRWVYEGIWQGNAVVVKRFMVYPKQMRHARKEWHGLAESRKRGLPMARPLFWAKDVEGECWIVMEHLPGVADFRSIWLETDAGKRRVAWEALWGLLGQQHEAGATQTDAHLGNYLWDGQHAFLCDAGGLKFYSAALNPAQRRDHLAWVFAFGRVYWEAEMWDAFPKYFIKELDDREELGRREKFTRLLARKVRKQRVRLHQKSYAKTRRGCSEWALETISSGTLRYQRDLPKEMLEKLRNCPDALIEEGLPLKLGNTCTLARWRDGVGREWVVKRYNPKPLGYRLRHRFQESRAMRSWSVGLTLRDLNIRTPRPMACLECRDWSGLRSAYLVMEQMAGEPMSAFALNHRSDPDGLEKVANEMRWIWGAWGHLNCVHGDMKATNFLVGEQGEVTVLDLDAFEFLVFPDRRFRAQRAKDWQRFMKNWREIPEVEAVFREIPDTCESRVS